MYDSDGSDDDLSAEASVGSVIGVPIFLPGSNQSTQMQLNIKNSSRFFTVQEEKERIFREHNIQNPQLYKMKIYVEAAERIDMIDTHHISHYVQYFAVGAGSNTMLVFEHI